MSLKLFTFVVLTLICGISITGLHTFKSEQIEYNRKEFALRTIRQLVNQKQFSLVQINDERYAIKYQNTYDGAVFKIRTPSGYNGEIILWIATNSAGYIRGVRVLEHKETPGIGDLIDIEVSDWIHQFIGMSLKNNWTYDNSDIDHVSGATITTRAVTEAVFDALKVETE